MTGMKRRLSLLLVAVLCLAMAFPSYASEVSDIREKGQKLKDQKEEAEKEKKTLNKKLKKILKEMEEIEEEIEAKEEELSLKEEELIQAQVEENDQFESMKKRIKYMYENGTGQLVQILFESKNISEFLNKAEYISTISEYDRDMLKVFQQIVKDVEEQKEVIRKEYEEMEDMQNELISKQNDVKNLLKSTNAKIDELEDDIKKNAKKLEKAVADAERKQQEAASNSGSAGESVVVGNGTFTHPCPGYRRISSYFGYRKQPLPGASTNHKGIDFAAATGTPIYAAAAGTVISSGYSGNAGKMIVINHGNGVTTYYMHCNALYVSAGQKVTKGQNIAVVGSTGNSTGPHLHFQVNVNGVPQNPLNYL